MQKEKNFIAIVVVVPVYIVVKQFKESSVSSICAYKIKSKRNWLTLNGNVKNLYALIELLNVQRAYTWLRSLTKELYCTLRNKIDKLGYKGKPVSLNPHLSKIITLGLNNITEVEGKICGNIWKCLPNLSAYCNPLVRITT